MKIERIIDIQQDITSILNNHTVPTTSRGTYVISIMNHLKKQLRKKKRNDRIASIILITILILVLSLFIFAIFFE